MDTCKKKIYYTDLKLGRFRSNYILFLLAYINNAGNENISKISCKKGI